MILTALPPWWVNLLPPIVMIALLPLLIRGSYLLIGWGSDWKSLQKRFPTWVPQTSGETYKGQSGGITVGSTGYSWRGLKVGVAPAGIYLYPPFARRSPCFIPWSSIRRAAVRGGSISVTVEYEKAFYFSLPGKALPALEAHLPPDKIQRGLPTVPAVLAGFAWSYWGITIGVFGTLCFAVLETVSSLSVWKELLISAVAGALGVVGMYLVLPSPQGKRPKRGISGEAQTLKAQTDLERPV